MSPMPLDSEIFKATPFMMIYQAGDHKLTFSATFDKHQFGYTVDDYLNKTYEKMNARYGMSELGNKEAYRQSLLGSTLAFES